MKQFWMNQGRYAEYVLLAALTCAGTGTGYVDQVEAIQQPPPIFCC